jgi:phospholipase C
MCARPSRALPYELQVAATVSRREPPHIELRFANTGAAGAVFQVYDRKHLDRVPRRYTVEPDRHLVDRWELAADAGDYDLWLIGPNGFHRHFTGRAGHHPAAPEVDVAYLRGDLALTLRNRGVEPSELTVHDNAYQRGDHTVSVPPGQDRVRHFALDRSAHWYDFTVVVRGTPGFSRRFAGRIETGRDSLSDPALGGPARGDQA